MTRILDELEFYKQSDSVQNMHSIWRMGFSDNIALLVSKDEDSRKEYIFGVMTIALLLYAFFTVWAVFLFVQALRSPQKARLCSGRIGHYFDEESRRRAVSKQGKLQVVFCLLGLGIIAGCSALVYSSLPRLQKTVLEVTELHEDIMDAIDEGLQVAISSLEVEQRLRNNNSFDRMFDETNICPNSDNVELLKDANVNATLNSINNSLNLVKGYMAKHEVSKMKKHLIDITETSKKFTQVINIYEANDWLVKLLVMIICVLTIFMTTSAILNFGLYTSAPLRMVMRLLIIPMFLLSVKLMVLFTIATFVFALTNADFCAGGRAPGSPEGTVEDMLFQRGIKPDDLTYQSFLYYRSDCLRENPWTYISDYGVEIEKGINSTNLLGLFFEENGISNMTELCGNDIAPVVSELQSTGRDLTTLSINLQSTVELARCGRVRPLYRRVFYGATCRESVQGFTYAFSAFLCISICGFGIISCRSALYKLIPLNVDQSFVRDEYDEYFSNMHTLESGNKTPTLDNLSSSSENSNTQPLSPISGLSRCNSISFDHTQQSNHNSCYKYNSA